MKYFLSKREFLTETNAITGNITNTIADKCTWYNSNTTPLYRGIKHSESDFVILKPSDVAKNDFLLKASFSSILLSNLESWKKFPKRKNSIVVTTDSKTAEEYGTLYRIIPFEKLDIAICPSTTLDRSFNNSLEKLGINFLSEFDNLLLNTFKLTLDSETEIEATDYSLLKSSLNSLKNSDNQKRALMKGEVSETIKKFFNEITNFNGDVVDYLNNLLHPNKNGFELMPLTTNFTIIGKKECWFYGNAVAINEEQMNSLDI